MVEAVRRHRRIPVARRRIRGASAASRACATDRYTCSTHANPLTSSSSIRTTIARHDVNTTMAMFTDDATYGWGDYFTSSDKTLIRNWLKSTGAALNMQTTVNACKLTDPTVTCDWRYVEECGRIGATGNFGVDATVVFTVNEGKISRIVVAPNLDSGYYKWEQAFLKWLADTNPTEARSFTQALDTLKFGREFGERLSELCKEHADSLKATTAAPRVDAPRHRPEVSTRSDATTWTPPSALFTDDAKYAWGDYFTTSDKTMIRNWLEYAAALNMQTKANDCKTSNSTVSCEWRFVHDCFGAEGAIGAGYDMGGISIFTVKDGKITSYVLTTNPDPEYNQWEEAFFKWLEDSYPMDIGSVVEALHTWKFDREFGGAWLSSARSMPRA